MEDNKKPFLTLVLPKDIQPTEEQSDTLKKYLTGFGRVIFAVFNGGSCSLGEMPQTALKEWDKDLAPEGAGKILVQPETSFEEEIGAAQGPAEHLRDMVCTELKLSAKEIEIEIEIDPGEPGVPAPGGPCDMEAYGGPPDYLPGI